MNNYVFKGVAALVLGGFLAGCSHDEDWTDVVAGKLKAYDEVFKGEYGTIDPTQNWGFGTLNAENSAKAVASITVDQNYGETYTVKVFSNDPLKDKMGVVLAKGTIQNGETFTKEFNHAPSQQSFMVGITNQRGLTSYRQVMLANGKLEAKFGGNGELTRSISSPTVEDITIPDDTYAKSFLDGAVEPTDENVIDNFDHSWSGDDCWVDGVHYAHYDYVDETYVRKFKITGSWDKLINVLATEAQYGDARTVYIGENGYWAIPEGKEQRVGGGAVIVIDNGGELHIPEGALMNFVNQARLVVMPGGKITGDGKIQVTNGNAAGLEGYNGGTIDIGTFNNNFGKFHNYGLFKCTLLEGGAGLSNFYNHGVAHIVRSGNATEYGGDYNTANTRIYNECQFYCEKDMRVFVLENAPGSYFHVGGELMMSDGEDGNATNSYVALGNGSLVRVGTLWNNNSSWVGPTAGSAVVELGGIRYLNVTGNNPVEQGYFINNLYISVDDKTLLDRGGNNYDKLKGWYLNGYGHDTYYVTDTNLHAPNGAGNLNAVIVEEGEADISIPASEGFVLGESGCSPGYEGGTGTSFTPEKDEIPVVNTEEQPLRSEIETTTEYYETTQVIEQGRVFCEDLGKISTNDLDFNDVVFDAYIYKVAQVTRTIIKVDGKLQSDDTEETSARYYAKIVLLAAGGTLPLKVANVEVHNAFGNYSTTTIINTITEEGSAFGNSWAVEPPKDLGIFDGYSSIAEIPITIFYDSGDVLTLTAESGEAPHKICVPIGIKWAKERVKIDEAYTEFQKYVNQKYDFWSNGMVKNNVYDLDGDNYTELSTAVKSKKLPGGSTEYTYEVVSSEVTGGYQGGTVLSRRK